MTNSSSRSSGNNPEWALAEENAKEAASAVGEMTGHAAAAVGAMAKQATRDAERRADDLVADAGVGIQGMGDRLSQNTPQSGVLGTVSQSVARSVKEGGQYLEDRKLSGITEEVAQVIRRNPIPSVLIAIGLGWFVARKLKG